MSKFAKKTEAQKVEALEAVKAKIAKAQEQLEQQLAALQTGDDWKHALEAMAVLGPTSIGRFSFGNVLLLLAQRGPVGHAATFKAWQRHGRNVKKGERGAVILRPRIVKKKSTDANGQPEDQKFLAGFSYLTVFSLDQTEGPELLQGLPRDFGTPEGFTYTVEALTKLVRLVDGISGVTLRPRRAADHQHAEGWFNKGTREIVVITGEKSEAQTLSTLLHEVAHAVLHGDGEHHATPTAEVEAESTAYVVSHALGLDTGAYSLPYVATWANRSDEKNPTKAVQRVGERVRKAASIILDVLCPALSDDVDEEGEQHERAA